MEKIEIIKTDKNVNKEDSMILYQGVGNQSSKSCNSQSAGSSIMAPPPNWLWPLIVYKPAYQVGSIKSQSNH